MNLLGVVRICSCHHVAEGIKILHLLGMLCAVFEQKSMLHRSQISFSNTPLVEGYCAFEARIPIASFIRIIRLTFDPVVRSELQS